MTGIDELSRSLGRIEATLDGIKVEQKSQSDKLDTVESRVGSLEKRAATAGGIAGVIVSVFTSLVAYNLRGVGVGIDGS